MTKPVTVQGYQCEKCGEVSFRGLEVAERHEKIEITSDNRLDGLLVKRSVWPRNGRARGVYTLIVDTKKISGMHKRLYSWTDYDRKTLDVVEEESVKLPPEIEKPFRQLFGLPLEGKIERYAEVHGFGGVMSSVLYRGSSENTYKNYESWNNLEFERVSERLKKKYPEKYQSIKFKQRVPQLR